MESPADRLRSTRVAKGIKSAAKAAEAMGLNISTYRHHENGTREYAPDAAQRYARFFGVTPEWLMYGINKGIRTVELVGYIGAGAEFQTIDDHAKGAGFETIAAPPGLTGDAVAVQVRGDSMVPVYNDGDILIYGEREYRYTDYLNKRCVCALSDGRVLVKTLQRGSTDELFTLISFNSSPIEDVAIEWIAKIKWVQPR